MTWLALAALAALAAGLLVGLRWWRLRAARRVDAVAGVAFDHAVMHSAQRRLPWKGDPRRRNFLQSR